jgi:hypothetical protein
LGILLAACGDDAPGDSADAAVRADGADGEDGGVMDDAATAEGDAAPIEPPPAGVLRTSYFSATSYDYGEVESGLALAGFYDQEPSPVTRTVTGLEGDCQLEVSTSVGDPGAGAFPDYRDAGVLRIDGAELDVELGYAGYYEPFQTESARLWGGGESLRFEGGGGADIGAFEATLLAPSHVVVTAPVFPLGDPAGIAVARDRDLAISWTGSSAGDVVVRVTGPIADGTQELITCRFSPEAGRGTVPASALARLTVTGEGTVTIDVRSARTIGVEGWGAVELDASVAAVAMTGHQYSTIATIR